MGATQGRANRSLSSRTCRHDTRCVPDCGLGQYTDHQYFKDSPAGRPCLQRFPRRCMGHHGTP
eukprot:9195553-Pyramimonas_sp.AAC.1